MLITLSAICGIKVVKVLLVLKETNGLIIELVPGAETIGIPGGMSSGIQSMALVGIGTLVEVVEQPQMTEDGENLSSHLGIGSDYQGRVMREIWILEDITEVIKPFILVLVRGKVLHNICRGTKAPGFKVMNRGPRTIGEKKKHTRGLLLVLMNSDQLLDLFVSYLTSLGVTKVSGGAAATMTLQRIGRERQQVSKAALSCLWS